MIKKQSLLFLLFFTTVNFAQTALQQSLSTEKISRWSIDVSTGQSKALAPFTSGYFARGQANFFEDFEINYFGAVARYMFSPKFGFNFGMGYSTLKNNKDSNSLPFEMRSFRYNVQGVINATRLFDIQDNMGRFGLLLHAGLDGTSITPQIGINQDTEDFNSGFIIGVSPQFRISKKIAVFGDVSGVKYIRQNLNWDGATSQGNQTLAGALLTYTVGLSFSFGQGNIHGDWAKIPTNNVNLKPLEDRVNKMENMIVDSDKDGILDYLDIEKNSTIGALVDAKGRMIDRDRNGIADELERYLDGRGGTTAAAPETSDMVAKFINDGYVASYFEYDETTVTQISQQSISLVTTYLKNNQKQNVSILAYADAVGNIASNKNLATMRAENVKSLLMKAGVAESRLNIVSIDNADSVYTNSAVARTDARRVTFKIE